MAFPADPLDLTAELHLGGAWTDITGDVFARGGGGVAVARGRADEGTRADPSRGAFTLRNADGRYSPRNPAGPYYGLIGRNTPCRFSVAGSTTYLYLPGDTASKATAPDTAALSVTGDLDIRVDVEMDNWRTSADFAGKYVTSGNQRSWSFALHNNGSGLVVFSWSPDGTLAATVTVVSTAPAPAPITGRQTLRATLDVNNGSGGNTVTFYYGPSLSGPWTQLGDPVVNSGVTSVFNSTVPVELGDIGNLTALPVKGRMFGFQMRNGINGTIVANPDFTSQAPGAASFADTASPANTWTLAGTAEITNRDVRFVGEVASWPTRWDVSGRDVWVDVEAAGIQRRLGQGAPVDGSTLRRGMLLDASSVVAYWPMEDAEGSTSLAAATPSTPPLTIIGTPDLATFADFPASMPLPVLQNASFTSAVPAYAPTTQTQIRWVLRAPAAGDSDDQAVVTIYTSGTLSRWECHYGVSGTLGLRAYTPGGTTPVFDTGDMAVNVNGKTVLVSVELTQNGANIDWTFGRLEPGQTLGSFTSGTAAGHTVGRVSSLVVNPNGGLLGSAVGHLSVQAAITSFFELSDQMVSWAGETAGRRIVRLCAEEGIECVVRGDIDTTAQMGPQYPNTLLELLSECAETDGGILYEPRDMLGLAYRTRESLYNQPARAALDYAAGHLSPPLEPIDDDQQISNDITVTRRDGSSARAVLESGPLSVAPPPAGVGRYDEQVTIAPRYDAALPDQASWRLHLGTVDETRYPVVTVNLAQMYAAGEGALAGAVAAAEVGDLFTIDNPPPWLPPGQIRQLGLGYGEELGLFDWRISINGVPASPYQVAAYDVAGRYGPHSTVTAEALDPAETAIDITTPAGPLWDPAESGYDVLIGGERMTVTAVSAPTGTTQTLTVVRAVNGVTKPHSAGAVVELAEPVVYAL